MVRHLRPVRGARGSLAFGPIHATNCGRFLPAVRRLDLGLTGNDAMVFGTIRQIPRQFGAQDVEFVDVVLIFSFELFGQGSSLSIGPRVAVACQRRNGLPSAVPRLELSSEVPFTVLALRASPAGWRETLLAIFPVDELSQRTVAEEAIVFRAVRRANARRGETRSSQPLGTKTAPTQPRCE